MLARWRKKDRGRSGPADEARLREKYASFRSLLSLNSECLESIAGLQEDLREPAGSYSRFLAKNTASTRYTPSIHWNMLRIAVRPGQFRSGSSGATPREQAAGADHVVTDVDPQGHRPEATLVWTSLLRRVPVRPFDLACISHG